MTREEILNEFKVDEHGIIHTPGKFEGEMLYAPYFYEQMLDGDGEEVYDEMPDDFPEEDAANWERDLLYTELVVLDWDRTEFPELDRSTTCVRVFEDSQGFVSIDEVSEDD